VGVGTVSARDWKIPLQIEPAPGDANASLKRT
jgi:hypothetical protein